MVVINYNSREVSCKIVYYGPGLSGKTTNLQYVHSKVPGKTRGDLISLATDADRTLYFDFLPINIGDINGFTTKFQLYTVPGQVFYNATRKLVLRGVDGIVFVADSQRAKAEENVESLDNLRENLAEYALDLRSIPFVLQYNKQDLPDVMTSDELNDLLNDRDWPVFEACASQGKGVFDTLKYVIKLVLDRAKRSSETMKRMETRMVEDAQLPPEEAVESVPITQEPVPESGRTQRPETVPSAPAEDESVTRAAKPIEKPRELERSHITVPQSQPIGNNAALAASVESPVGPVPDKSLSDNAPAATTGVPTSGTAVEIEMTRQPGVAVADRPEAVPAESEKPEAEETPVTTQVATHDETGHEDKTGDPSADQMSDAGEMSDTESQSAKQLLRRLGSVDDTGGQSEPADEPDDEQPEGETFAVPSMQSSLRRKKVKKKKRFFLFRWLFRRS